MGTSDRYKRPKHINTNMNEFIKFILVIAVFTGNLTANKEQRLKISAKEREEVFQPENSKQRNEETRLRAQVDKQNQEILKLREEIQALRQADSKRGKSFRQRYQNSNQGLRGNAKSAFPQDDILDNLDSLVKMALKKSIDLSLKHEIRKTILLLEQADENICLLDYSELETIVAARKTSA